MSLCEYGQHCTCFIDKFVGVYWGDCCKLHDVRYGNKRLTRYQADILLKRCVTRKTNILLGYIMFAGVRTFGWYFYSRVNKG